ncbi:hypothetical protein Q8F55_009178 [Vanrija albida]|uniref:Fork-head domain-containing protein n=1 Tax=Vanrija albida TaxID=181172 RepID=A0ABR3PSW8_9TREE
MDRRTTYAPPLRWAGAGDAPDDDEHPAPDPARTEREDSPLEIIPTVFKRPLTLPAPNDAAVRALSFSQSAKPGVGDISLDREELVRLREGHFHAPRRGGEGRNWAKMTLSEAVWIRVEEVGAVTKSRSWTARVGYDDSGEPVKPELPYVILTKLVIASSPRKMLTLNQIYQAMEERWPYFRHLGQTFRNSIRHNLSMNPAFVNVERPCAEGGFGTGKGGYWKVSDDATASHRGRARRSSAGEDEGVSQQQAPATTTAPRKPNKRAKASDGAEAAGDAPSVTRSGALIRRGGSDNARSTEPRRTTRAAAACPPRGSSRSSASSDSASATPPRTYAYHSQRPLPLPRLALPDDPPRPTQQQQRAHHAAYAPMAPAAALWPRQPAPPLAEPAPRRAAYDHLSDPPSPKRRRLDHTDPLYLLASVSAPEEPTSLLPTPPLEGGAGGARGRVCTPRPTPTPAPAAAAAPAPRHSLAALLNPVAELLTPLTASPASLSGRSGHSGHSTQS